MPESHKSTQDLSSAATASSDVFSFTALSRLELISGSPSTLPYRPPSSTIPKAPELGSVVSFRFAINCTAPVNRLPCELVVQILTSGAWTRWQDLVALTHICQHWRSMALGTPQLWADAARSVFAGPCTWYGREIRWPKCLPVFLARSEPSPLAVDFPDHLRLTVELSLGGVLLPHVSRLAHLCVYVETADGLQAVLWLVHTQMRNIESLHIHQIVQLSGVSFSVEKLPPWDEAYLPHLHTLTMPGHYFGRAIAVALKALVLYGGPRRHDVFLAALERCGPTLESLTLRDWSHPVKGAPSSTAGTVQLPRLRRLEVSLPAKNSATAPPTSLFTVLSFPPDVVLDLDWHSNPGNTLELFPKHFASDLHAPPPIIDTMCLHLFCPSPQPLTASLHGYVDGRETLCVREEPILDLAYHKRHRPGLLGRFPDGHTWPHVTQLAVALDVDKLGYDWDVQRLPGLEQLLYAFVRAFPGLRRLDLLGRSMGAAKLRMVDAFLDIPYVPDPSEAGTGRTLGYVCAVPEHCAKATMAASTAFVDSLRAQLDALEARLVRHLAQGSSRLHRLELCVGYSTRSSPPAQRGAFPDVRDVEPSIVLTEHLSSVYLPRFKTLVDEVVFVRADKARKPGFRVITRAERRHLVPGLKSHSGVPRLGGRETRRGPSGGRKGR